MEKHSKKQIILVTGGSGLVGRAIEKFSLKHQDYTWIFLSSKSCDLTDYHKTKIFFQQIKPDYIIHLAANVGGLFKNMNFKVDMLEVNLDINKNVLKCAHEVNVKKLIACLSTCIFPDKTTYPINEKMLHNGPPHFSNDAYAYAKRLLEVHCRAYQEQYGDNFICVIPTNIYGPHDNFNLQNAHVIPALIHKCYLAKKNSETFTIYGTGKPLRQFIYSDDLAQLIIWTLFNYEEKEPIILSVDENDEVSIGQVASLIAKYSNYDKIEFNPKFSDGQYKKTASNEKLRKYLPNFEFLSIDKGICETVKWFNQNFESARK